MLLFQLATNQTNPLAIPQVPPLPAPPILQRLLFEQPLPLIALLVVAGVAAFVLLNARAKARLGIMVALVLFLAALGFFALAAAVQTGREQTIAATRALAAATATLDEPALGRLLASDATLMSRFSGQGFSVPIGGADKEQTISLARAALSTYPIKSHATPEAQAQVTGPNTATTQVLVRVVPEFSDLPHHSWWKLSWRRDAEGTWRCTSIEPLAIQWLSGR